MKKQLKKTIIFLLKIFEKTTYPLKKHNFILLAAHNQLMFENLIHIKKILSKNKKNKLFFCFYPPKIFEKNYFKKIKNAFPNIPYFLAKFLKWDVIIFPDHDYGFRKDVKKIYLGHGVPLLTLKNGGIYRCAKEAFNDDGSYKYTFIILHSETQKKTLIENYPQLKEKIKIAGNLRMYEISQTNISKREIFKKNNLDERKKTIFIVSTWKNSLLSNFSANLSAILPTLCKEYNVLMSSHYRTITKEDKFYIKESEYFKTTKLNSFKFLPETTWIPFIRHTDILISDHSSMSAYFLPYIKHFIFLKLPNIKIIKNSLFDKIKDISTTIYDLDNIYETIKKSELKDFNRHYKKLVYETLGNYEKAPEQIEKIIYEAIRKQNRI